MEKYIKDSLESALSLHEALLKDLRLQNSLSELAGWCVESLRNGGKIIFAGNGGSFADAQHLAAEFVSRLQFDRSPLPSIALATNSSVMSAIGNDYGYEQVFSRELKALGNQVDIFIPITTSGNSLNILSAVEVAQERSIRTIGFTGQSGGLLVGKCNCLSIPSSRTERIQEGHILIGHILCGIVENELFKNR
jgi:D-sedoheptulose 7-phosphate isomerase